MDFEQIDPDKNTAEESSQFERVGKSQELTKTLDLGKTNTENTSGMTNVLKDLTREESFKNQEPEEQGVESSSEDSQDSEEDGSESDDGDYDFAEASEDENNTQEESAQNDKNSTIQSKARAQEAALNLPYTVLEEDYIFSYINQKIESVKKGLDSPQKECHKGLILDSLKEAKFDVEKAKEILASKIEKILEEKKNDDRFQVDSEGEGEMEERLAVKCLHPIHFEVKEKEVQKQLINGLGVIPIHCPVCKEEIGGYNLFDLVDKTKDPE